MVLTAGRLHSACSVWGRGGCVPCRWGTGGRSASGLCAGCAAAARAGCAARRRTRARIAAIAAVVAAHKTYITYPPPLIL